jgi:outer membrane receptor protein involved in Fe transport
MKKSVVFTLVSLLPLAAQAQEPQISQEQVAQDQTAQDQTAQADAPPQTAIEQIIVTGVVFRNRTESVEPKLSYDLEYFQRFEPLTAGDALKRVPSVQFLSDVIEWDGARLRGLDPGYTQILINGEKVPGAGVDRSFFVDRIPAELIERVEIVRSSSANRSGDAVAGALNIVLRDAYALDGGYVRAGASLFNDDKVKGTLGGVYGGELGPGRVLLGANVQGRRNPKEKISERYSRPGGTLDNVETQTDVRNGTDYSLNGSYLLPLETGKLELTGLYVRTDRLQDENSIEYRNGLINNANLLTINNNPLDIDTQNWSLTGKGEFEMGGGKTKIKVGYANFDDEQEELEEETEYLRDAIAFPEDDRFTGDLTFTDLKDEETTIKVSHAREASDKEIEIGVEYNDKNRNTNITTDRNRITIPNAPAARPDTPGAYGPFVPVAGGVNTIQEERIDPYAMLSGEYGILKWEAGVRYEMTDVTIEDLTAPAARRLTENDYNFWLPSAHLQWNLTQDDRINTSVARTVRRPRFNDLSPAALLAEKGDNDYIGNPNLKPETAWGVDVGYEHNLGRRGVVGINVFYRDVTNVIEDFSTGTVGSVGPGTFIFSTQNTGDGEVWGAEFDLSTPLAFAGLDDTGIFLNASLLDSKITDLFGERQFNDQTDYVFNAGLIQDLPAWGAAFGATYRKQGKAFGRVIGEEVTTTYGADLAAFVEKRFGESLVVRFVGSNLLNAKKRETFDKFTTLADQRTRSYDEYELEREKAGRVFQLVARYAF